MHRAAVTIFGAQGSREHPLLFVMLAWSLNELTTYSSTQPRITDQGELMSLGLQKKKNNNNNNKKKITFYACITTV